MGGIGNQLFQYALGKHLAIKNNTKLKLDLSSFKNKNHRPFMLNHFNIVVNEANEDEIPYLKKASSKNKIKRLYFKLKTNKSLIYDEKQFHYDSEVLNCKDGFYIYGYWQCEKYFSPIKNIIKQELTFRKELNNNLKKIIELIENTDSISMHIRRGDYVGNEHHNVLDIKYYYQAIELVCMNLISPFIFIFSDDIEWCKLNLKLHVPYKIISGNEDWEDLKLMTLCKHNIIANSSFSWWGAYLGEYYAKKVVGPEKWFCNTKYKLLQPCPDVWFKL